MHMNYSNNISDIPVDLIINVYEKTYRNVCCAGFFRNVENQNKFAFANKILLISNVDDPIDAETRAHKLIEAGEITSFFHISDYADIALHASGLSYDDLGRIPYYSLAPLVSLVIPGNDWFLYWDAEIFMNSSCNWIRPSIEFMINNPRTLVANPKWLKCDTIYDEAIEIVGDFAISYGFSDQCYLARKSDLARPIYHYWCPISYRYPLAHISPNFEQRVDAFMRKTNRTRLTYLLAGYRHPENEGESYPGMCIAEHFMLLLYKLFLLIMEALPSQSPCIKINPSKK